MSENIPESVPTSVSHRSQRPAKKRALTPASAQSQQVEALFANPDRAEFALPAGPKAKTLAAPPEIVANVQGSSAGAGSGEFHVYKASRRREYERQRMMDEEVKEEEAEKDFQQKKEEREKADAEKLSKNRAKREKARARQNKKKLGGAAMEDIEGTEQKEGQNGTKKKLVPARIAQSNGDAGAREKNGEDEVAQEETGITIHDDD